jgi:hypothetical protein
MCYRCPHATERGAPAVHGRARPNDRGAAPAEPLDFETWAALSAALLVLDAGQRLAVLAAVGIAPDHWARSDDHRAALVDDCARLNQPHP